MPPRLAKKDTSKKLERTLTEVIEFCAKYTWFYNKRGGIRCLLDPKITYPIDYPFEDPLAFYSNERRRKRGEQTVLPAYVEIHAEELGVSVEEYWSLLGSIDYSPKVPYGDQWLDAVMYKRFNNEFRKRFVGGLNVQDAGPTFNNSRIIDGQ